MKQVSVLLLIAFAFAMPSIVSAQVTGDMQTYPYSAAYTPNVLAGYFNPAGLSPGSTMGLRYMHSFTDSTYKGDDGFILATRGTFLSIQWLKHTNNIFRRKYTIGSSNMLFRGFFWGVTFSYFNGANDDNNKTKYNSKKSWKSGILYYLQPNITLALVADNITRTSFGAYQSERLYTVAAAYKAMRGKLVFSADMLIDEKAGFDDSEARLTIAYRARRKFMTTLDYSTDGFMRFGFGYYFGYIDIGGVVRFDEGDYKGGSYYYNQGPMSAPSGN